MELLTSSDHLSVTPDGELAIEGVSVGQLLEQYGSPLYVVSEATLRTNFRRIKDAFSSAWPNPVNIMYAIKANTSLAVRAILHDEGAGGDCFSEGELYATFEGGADPSRIALNGGCKSENTLRIAVERGVTVNIDAESEIDALPRICRELDRTARVNIRLKPLNPDYDEVHTDYFGGAELADYVRRAKWGFSVDSACRLIHRIKQSPELDLAGFSTHIGRVSREERFFREFGRAIGQMVVSIQRQTGFAPRILDIGGGWPRERDPESRSRERNLTPVETYAHAACSAIAHCLQSAGIPLPELWVEPGRYIIGNACLLLTTAGAIKHDLGLTWVHVDAGTNELPRIDTSGSAYHVIPATGMNRKISGVADIVGPTCIDSLLRRDLPVPDLQPGDVLAVLDAGMYAESASTQFNSIPRPATVLISGSRAEIIRQREKMPELFRHHRIPDRLRKPG